MRILVLHVKAAWLQFKNVQMSKQDESIYEQETHGGWQHLCLQFAWVLSSLTLQQQPILADLLNHVSAIHLQPHKCQSLLHLAPQIQSKWWNQCNRDLVY